MTRYKLLALLIAIAPAKALAQAATDDGYCDYVEGSASADAATLQAPQLFGQFGYIEQPQFAETPTTGTSNLRLLGGIRYSITNILAGSATKSRAKADCRRHKASAMMRNATTMYAVAARVKVLEEAQPEAEKMLAEINAGLEARRVTIPEATAMRLRVEELRSLAAVARRELAALPARNQQSLRTVLEQYRDADADMERSEARLRSLRAYDLSVRVGLDQFLEGPDTGLNYFAVVQVGVNLGALWVGSGNSRAAAGRKRFARTADPLYDTSIEQLEALIDADTRRVQQLTALVNDLGQQVEQLARLGTEDSRRYRATIWFDWVRAKAELAYAQASVEALGQLLAMKQ